MISTSTAERIPFTPAWREGQPDAPIFYLRAGSVIERAQMEAELTGPLRAGRVLEFELRQAMESGVTVLLDGEDRDFVLELLEQEAAGEEVELGDNAKTMLERTRQILGEHWDPYRELIAQISRRRELAPIVALKRFCVDIAATGVTVGHGVDGLLSDATMRRLDPFEMTAAGYRAYSLQYVDEETRGNSARPSSSENGPPTSNSDVASTAAGTSPAKPGKKTRGSRSRRGSGASSTSTS